MNYSLVRMGSCSSDGMQEKDGIRLGYLQSKACPLISRPKFAKYTPFVVQLDATPRPSSLGLVPVPSRDHITGPDPANASHVTGRGGKTRLSCIQKSLQKSTCSARQESRTRVYRAPCWTNRIPDLSSSFYIAFPCTLTPIRGAQLRANPQRDLAGAYRTRLGLSTCISALEGPGRHSFLPPHTLSLFLFFFFVPFRQLLRRLHSLASQPPAPLLGGALIVFFFRLVFLSSFLPYLFNLFAGIAL